VFLDRHDLARCRSVRRVFCSGEALTAELRDRFFERLPGPALVNLYGPTETAVHVTGWTCTPEEKGPVPIGRALPNVRAYIVDEAMNVVGEGVPGELLIGGVQVARGYLGREALTRERFVPDPFSAEPGARCYRTGDCVAWRADGVIDYFGRFDGQVQLGGTRVEPAEIEAALRPHPAVADVAVVAQDTADSIRLVAYIRRVNGAPDPPTDVMRRFLSDKVPDCMIPGRWVWLDEFPVTATGKLDRRALTASEVAQPSEQLFEPPVGPTETQLAQIWCRELTLARVGRHDDFHLLGGDSLSVIRLIEEIRTSFGVDLPPSELLRSPTLAALAARIVADTAPRRSRASIVTLRPGNGGEPLYLPPAMGGQLLYWRDLVRALGSDRPIYGFTLSEDAESPDLQTLAATLVRELVAFQPQGPYHLAGYSFSAALALEMAQQLRAAGRRVGVLAVIDYGPGLPDDKVSVARSAGDFIRNLPNWVRYDALQSGWKPLAQRVVRKLGTLGEKMVSVGRSTAGQSARWTVDEIFDQRQLPVEHRRLAILHLEAFYRYEPSHYSGAVLFFSARCRPLFHSLSPTLGWDTRADLFERVIVDCNHDNILMPPHVGVIAAHLDRAIEADALTARRVASRG
jgi:thioesterase domain-containing protein/acyl carrier protein